MDYWTVTVRIEPDPERHIERFERRYRFEGDEAASEAWSCCAAAINAGFTAIAEQVRTRKVAVPS